MEYPFETSVVYTEQRSTGNLYANQEVQFTRSGKRNLPQP